LHTAPAHFYRFSCGNAGADIFATPKTSLNFFPFFTPLLVDGPRTFGKYQKRWKTEKKKGAE